MWPWSTLQEVTDVTRFQRSKLSAGGVRGQRSLCLVWFCSVLCVHSTEFQSWSGGRCVCKSVVFLSSLFGFSWCVCLINLCHPNTWSVMTWLVWVILMHLSLLISDLSLCELTWFSYFMMFVLLKWAEGMLSLFSQLLLHHPRRESNGLHSHHWP